MYIPFMQTVNGCLISASATLSMKAGRQSDQAVSQSEASSQNGSGEKSADPQCIEMAIPRCGKKHSSKENKFGLPSEYFW